MPVKLHAYKNSPPQPEGSRWLYTLGGDGSNGKEYVTKDFQELTDEVNRRRATKGLIKLQEAWETERPLEEIFDSKKCHEACTFKDDHGQSHKILRLRESTVRIYFIYPPPPPANAVLAIKVSTKYTEKLKSSDKNELARIANLVLKHQEEPKNEQPAINRSKQLR